MFLSLFTCSHQFGPTEILYLVILINRWIGFLEINLFQIIDGVLCVLSKKAFCTNVVGYFFCRRNELLRLVLVRTVIHVAFQFGNSPFKLAGLSWSLLLESEAIFSSVGILE